MERDYMAGALLVPVRVNSAGGSKTAAATIDKVYRERSIAPVR
jgi:hypothetical protein